MFVLILKRYSENFAFLILRIFDLFARKACIIFVYEHTKTIEHVKKWPTL